MLPRRFPLAVLILALGSCATPSAPPPARPVVTAPVRPAPPPPPASSDWRDWPLTPGNWRYTQTAEGSEASFGVAGAPPQMVLRCERDPATIFLSVTGPGGATIVRTSSTQRTLGLSQVRPDVASIALTPRDPLLDAMGFSRGRFVIEQGQRRLVVPAWAEVLRVTEDCRG